jgi:glucokinase
MNASHSKSPVVGIDLGGTNIQIGLVDSAGKIVARLGKKTKADNGPDAVIERIAKGVRDVCEQAGLSVKDLAGVGIAAAGAIDITTGIVLESPNLRWHNLSLRSKLEKELKTLVVVENDVNGAVWGEYKCGAAVGRGDVLGVWVGTGVGGGLVINGSIYHGDLHTAGEVGHAILFPDRPKGDRTVEDHCSRTGMARKILRRLHAHPDSAILEITGGTGEITGSKQFAKAYEANDPLAVDVIETGARLLGTAIASWVTVLALDTVIIGGGVTEALGQPYLDLVRQSFDEDVFPPTHRACELRATRLEDNAGVLGAAFLAQEAAATTHA